MKCVENVVETATLQKIVDFEKLLISSIEQLEAEIKELRKSKYFSTEILAQIEFKTGVIQQTKYLLDEVAPLHKMNVGDWVQNGSTLPGQIKDFILDKTKVSVEIEWWGGETNQKSPRALKLVSEVDMRYIWDGQKFEKLIRKCDFLECDQIEILTTEKNIAEEAKQRAIDFGQPPAIVDRYAKRIIYCEKRIKLLSGVKEKEVISTNQQQLLMRLYGNERLTERLQTLKIDQIKRNSTCQQRESLDLDVVEDYKNAFNTGAKLPPVKVKFDGEEYWLFDGFHTTEAAIKAGLTELRAEVTDGTLRDAILASVGVNSNHGLRRSNQTKRNAVMTMLKDEEWDKWSDREIAKQCKVSQPFVSKLRNDTDNSLERSGLHPKGHKPSNGGDPTRRVLLTDNVISEITKYDANNSTEINSSDNLRTYKNKYGNKSLMDVSNIGKSSCLPKDAFKDNTSTHKIEFFPNQLLQLKISALDSAPQQLRALNNRYCTIKEKAEIGNAYRVEFLEEKETHIVSANDLQVVQQAIMSWVFSPEEYFGLIREFGSIAAYKEYVYSFVRKGAK